MKANIDSKNTTTLFRAFYEAALKKDFEAVAEMIDEECEYVLEPDMETAKGKKAVVEMAGRGSLAFDRTQPEIIFDAANPDWGVFEFINQGTVAKGVVAFAAKSAWKFPEDPGTLVGRTYKVPVCIVYHINTRRKLSLIHEYTDVSSSMKSIK